MSISQTTARTVRKVGANGEPVFVYSADHFDTVINKAPQTEQVGTVVVATATSDYDYIVTINGEDATYTSDGTASKAEIADGLAEAINGNPAIRGQVSASSDGVDTVTVTALLPDTSFTMVDSGMADPTKLTTTAASTAADGADPISFGCMVYVDEIGTEGPEKFGTIPKSTGLDAQVDTLAVTYAKDEVYIVGIEIADESYSVEVTADTDTNTTATAIRAAINAMMPANSVLAGGSAGDVTLTAEKPGEPFKTSIGLKSGTASRLTLTHTTVGNVFDALAGIAVVPMDEETASGTDAGQYGPNVGVRVLRSGEVWIETSESPALNGYVYMETNGSNAGLLYATSSSTRIKLPKSIAKWQRVNSSDGLAAVAISLPLA